MATDAPAWAALKAQANAAYTAGRVDEAIDLYTRALASADMPPADRATLLANRAQALLRVAKHELAVEDCTACLTLSPDNVKAQFRR